MRWAGRVTLGPERSIVFRERNIVDSCRGIVNWGNTGSFFDASHCGPAGHCGDHLGSATI